MLKRSALSLLLAISSSLLLSEFCQAKRIEASDSDQKSKVSQKNLWVFSQETDGGRNYTVCVADGAVKFVTENMAIIARQPDWQVNVMNEKNRMFCQIPLQDFHGLTVVESFDVQKLDKVSDDAEEVIVKHPVRNYAGKPSPSDEKAKKLGFTPSKISVSICDDLRLDSESLIILSKLFGLSELKGLPLRIRMTTDKGEDIECLRTKWSLKRETAPLFFDVPKRFNRGKDLAEVENAKVVVRSLRPGKEATSHRVKELIKRQKSKPQRVSE